MTVFEILAPIGTTKAFHSYSFCVINIGVRKTVALVEMPLRRTIAHPSHPSNTAMWTVQYVVASIYTKCGNSPNKVHNLSQSQIF